MDHQCGLLTLVQDYTPSEFKNAVLALADTAKYFNLPTILTTSFEEGPNGPIVPELKEMFPEAPFIARPGQINAWDNEDFVKAVKATGRKQLIIAGIVTEVCVAFPALSAIEDGYEVFVITDASGTFDAASRHSAWLRMSAAGAQLLNCEVRPRDWTNRELSLWYGGRVRVTTANQLNLDSLDRKPCAIWGLSRSSRGRIPDLVSQIQRMRRFVGPNPSRSPTTTRAGGCASRPRYDQGEGPHPIPV